MNSHNYGEFWIPGKYWLPEDISNPRGKYVRAHRYVFEIEVGPIPFGLVLDHECHNKDLTCLISKKCLHHQCCNVLHLVPKTHGQNLRAARRARPNTKHDGTGTRLELTHCPQNHPYNEQNTSWVNRRGYRERYCKACNRDRAYKRKNGIERPGPWDESLALTDLMFCEYGHLWEETAKYDSTTGKKRCIECERRRWTEYRARKKGKLLV